MAIITVDTKADVPVQQLFNVWDEEYADIYKFHTGLADSYILEKSPQKSGLGALRHCAMADGKNWIREEVVTRIPNERLELDIYEFTFPMKFMRANFIFSEIGESSSLLEMTMLFEPKMGLFGKLMLPLMKKQFTPVMQGMIDNSAKYAKTGQALNAKRAA